MSGNSEVKIRQSNISRKTRDTPNFLHTAVARAACAPFYKERRYLDQIAPLDASLALYQGTILSLGRKGQKENWALQAAEKGRTEGEDRTLSD